MLEEEILLDVVCSGIKELVLWGVEEELVWDAEGVVLAGVDDGVLLGVLVVDGVVDGVDDGVVDAVLDELCVVSPVGVLWLPAALSVEDDPPMRLPSWRSAMALTSNLFISSHVAWATESIATAISSCWKICFEYMLMDSVCCEVVKIPIRQPPPVSCG